MNTISPDWFDVPGFNWNNLSSNGRIAARWVHAGAEGFPCYSRVSTDARGNIHEVKTSKTPKGIKDATDDMLAVVTWWTANPDDLVGVSAGDHLTIIDIDMDSDNEKPVDGWASLHEAGLSVPEEFMVTTPRGGDHVYCRTPEGVFPNSVANLRLANGTALKGVDRRARGGYFIGWSEEGIPDSIADLPFAPLEFCHVSSGSSQGVEYSGSVTDWLTSVGAGQPDALMKSVMRTKIPRGEFNHQEMRDIQRNILGVAAEGHPGGAVALEELRSEYLRGGYNTIRWESDFNAALAGAVLKFGGAADAGHAVGLSPAEVKQVLLRPEGAFEIGHSQPGSAVKQADNYGEQDDSGAPLPSCWTEAGELTGLKHSPASGSRSVSFRASLLPDVGILSTPMQGWGSRF